MIKFSLVTDFGEEVLLLYTRPSAVVAVTTKQPRYKDENYTLIMLIDGSEYFVNESVKEVLEMIADG